MEREAIQKPIVTAATQSTTASVTSRRSQRRKTVMTSPGTWMRPV
jgi:hypothetical protein